MSEPKCLGRQHLIRPSARRPAFPRIDEFTGGNCVNIWKSDLGCFFETNPPIRQVAVLKRLACICLAFLVIPWSFMIYSKRPISGGTRCVVSLCVFIAIVVWMNDYLDWSPKSELEAPRGGIWRCAWEWERMWQRLTLLLMRRQRVIKRRETIGMRN